MKKMKSFRETIRSESACMPLDFAVPGSTNMIAASIANPVPNSVTRSMAGAKTECIVFNLRYGGFLSMFDTYVAP
jgi:hypothetical protein